MNQRQARDTVALIVLGGHLAVFIAGMALGLLGPLRGTDLVQVALMASPILAVTAVAAARSILDVANASEQGPKVPAVFALLVIVYPTALILCIFGLFWCLYKQVSGFGPNELKVGLGAVETFFGVFIGLISDKLFGRLPKGETAQSVTVAP
jgi:hypothetical protein